MPAVVFSAAVIVLAGCPNPSGPGPDGELELNIPNLNVATWINEPRDDVDHLAPGRPYVLEFWATWCGPCVYSIPHLNELHVALGDQVTIVGITNEDEATVRSFVESMGDSMTYAVGLDPDWLTWSAYMTPYDQTGIPHAFIIVDGEVVNHLHPIYITEETFAPYL